MGRGLAGRSAGPRLDCRRLLWGLLVGRLEKPQEPTAVQRLIGVPEGRAGFAREPHQIQTSRTAQDLTAIRHGVRAEPGSITPPGGVRSARLTAGQSQAPGLTGMDSPSLGVDVDSERRR